MVATILLTFTSLFSTADSIRTEVIDGKTYIIHRVEQKETLFAISRRYGVALLAVVESNPNSSSGLEIGQLIKVPYNPNGRTTTAEGTIHRVGEKETLYSISKQYGVTVDEIKDWNKLTDNGLKLGQELLIKNKTISNSTRPVTTSAAVSSSANTHTVEQGETMYAISRKYGITVQQIKDWNYLTGNDLKPGQVIFVKEGQSVATRNNSNTTTTPSVSTPVTSATTSANTTSTTTTTPATSTAPGSNYIPITPVTNVVGNDEVHENGMITAMSGTEGNRKYLAHHRTAKIGTILHVKNNVNHREVFVRVVGNITSSDPSDVVIKVSQSAFDKLNGGESKFPVEVIYFK